VTDPTDLSCRFPDAFWFGSGTAGHQIEGDNVHSQEWHDEFHDERRKAAGKGCSGKACDHWNRWREDVALLAERLEFEVFWLWCHL
jgi:beta-glucosidase